MEKFGDLGFVRDAAGGIEESYIYEKKGFFEVRFVIRNLSHVGQGFIDPSVWIYAPEINKRILELEIPNTHREVLISQGEFDKKTFFNMPNSSIALYKYNLDDPNLKEKIRKDLLEVGMPYIDKFNDLKAFCKMIDEGYRTASIFRLSFLYMIDRIFLINGIRQLNSIAPANKLDAELYALLKNKT